MVRNYKKKSVVPDNRTEQIEAAIKLIQEKGFSIGRAAMNTSVPKETLRRWLKQRPMRCGSGSAKSVLNKQEEEDIVDALLVASKYGLPSGTEEIQRMVKSYLDGLGKQTAFKDNIPGKDWLIGFRRRHADVLSRRKPTVSTSRRILLESIVNAIVPKLSAETKLALESSGRKRKIEEATDGEVLTSDQVAEPLQLEAEESKESRKQKATTTKKKTLPRRKLSIGQGEVAEPLQLEAEGSKESEKQQKATIKIKTLPTRTLSIGQDEALTTDQVEEEPLQLQAEESKESEKQQKATIKIKALLTRKLSFGQGESGSSTNEEEREDEEDTNCVVCHRLWSSYKGCKGDKWVICENCDEYCCLKCIPANTDFDQDFYCPKCIAEH